MKEYTLITVLGWEERFLSGLEETLTKFNIRQLNLIKFVDYLHMNNMQINFIEVEKLSEKYGFKIQTIDLNYNDSIENWNTLEKFFNDVESNYLLNITTIPRETIWTLFFFLKKQINSIEYIYFKPKGYCIDWLTKNHKSPRLLFKHSGVFDLNKNLALFVIAGFDNTRLEQIIDFYEPTKIVVFYQKGNQFNNGDRNKDFEIYESKIKYCELVELDTYNIEETSQKISEVYDKFKNDYNVIIDSQGPKLSALSVYQVYLNSEAKIGLAYVAAKDFNSNYSTGIDKNFINGSFLLK